MIITCTFKRQLFLKSISCSETLALSNKHCRYGSSTATSVAHNESAYATIKPTSAIPEPKGLPLFGTLFDYMGPTKKEGFDFLKLFEVMQHRAAAYGPIYQEKIASFSSIVVSDPYEYKKVIYAEGKHPRRFELGPVKYYLEKHGQCLGLVNSQGEEWYRHRTILSKKLLRPKELVSYITPMNHVSNDFVKYLTSKRDSQTFVVNNLSKELFKWSLENVGEFLFDERIGCFKNPPPEEAQEFIDNLLNFFKFCIPLTYNVPLYKIYPTKTWREFSACFTRVTEIAQQYIDKKIARISHEINHRSSEQAKDGADTSVDFLTFLFSQEKLTTSEATAHATDIMMGGVETTANAMLWTLYELSKNEKVQEAFYNDVTSTLKNGEDISQEILSGQMQYVKACLKETLRLYPLPVTSSRYLDKDLVLCGYQVPAGSHIQANFYGMGRDANTFPDPLNYRPERWLRSDAKFESTNALASLPFGQGARMCIGRRLAEQEMYIGLVKIIQNFKLEYADTENVQPIFNLILMPDRPVKIKFIPRHQQI